MAYESGEMPYSKWTKSNIIDAIQEMVDSGDIFLNEESLKTIENMPLSKLRELFLKNSSWHHTSKFYNKTNFYEINVDYIEKNYEESKAFRDQEENKIREKERQEKTDRIQKWAESHKKEIEKIKSLGYDIPLENFYKNNEIVAQVFNKNYTQDVINYIMSRTDNLSKDLFRYMDENYEDGKSYWGPHDKNTIPTFSEFLNFDKEKNIGKKRINYDHDKNQYILEEFDGKNWKIAITEEHIDNDNDENITSKIKEVKRKMGL